MADQHSQINRIEMRNPKASKPMLQADFVSGAGSYVANRVQACGHAQHMPMLLAIPIDGMYHGAVGGRVVHESPEFRDCLTRSSRRFVLGSHRPQGL